jgi:uncharacterized protein
MPGTHSQMPTLAMPRVVHRHVEVNGLRIFYREAAAHEGAPTLLLLHGFPSGSHQFRRLMDAVIGASGHLGGAVAREALSRGHDVTAVARDTGGLRDLDGARAADADALDIDAMTQVLGDHDAVVAALKARDESEPNVVPDAAGALLAALPRAGVRRVVFVVSGGSLLSPSGQRFVDSPDFPSEYKGEALAQARALEILRAADGAVDWSYVSPPPLQLVEGEWTGRYRVRAGDLPITDDRGESRISVLDYAAAIVDALENGRFVGERFPAAY